MRTKGKPRTQEKRVTTGSMSPEFLRKVRIIGAHRNLMNHEVIDQFAGPAIDREYRRVITDAHELGNPVG